MKLKYAVIYERTPNNYGAYVPDLPGCISTGASWREIRDNIRAAIGFHLEGLMDNGDRVPEPRRSIGEAMTYHSEVLNDHGHAGPELETTVSMVEVEVAVALAPAVGIH